MKVKRALSAQSCRFSAQIFNLASIVAVLLPLPLLMIWVGASMFVYAANAHHPDERVARYTRRAGFRFYAVAGSLVIAGQPIISTLGAVKGVIVIWILLALGIIPAALWDIFKARREVWRDILLEVAVNE